MKTQMIGIRSRRRGLSAILATTSILGLTTLGALAQTSGNTGADEVISKVNGLVAVAAAVVAAAVLVVVVPWGAKMAVRAFKSIGGA